MEHRDEAQPTDLTAEELDALNGQALPDREAMSVIAPGGADVIPDPFAGPTLPVEPPAEA